MIKALHFSFYILPLRRKLRSKLCPQTFQFPQDLLLPPFCPIPVFPGHIHINRRNEKFRFGKIQLVIHQAPSGMVSLTAENGFFWVNAFRVQDFSGKSGVFRGKLCLRLRKNAVQGDSLGQKYIRIKFAFRSIILSVDIRL